MMVYSCRSDDCHSTFVPCDLGYTRQVVSVYMHLAAVDQFLICLACRGPVGDRLVIDARIR